MQLPHSYSQIVFYNFYFLSFILFIQWLRLKITFFNSQSQPLRVIALGIALDLNFLILATIINVFKETICPINL